MQEYGYAHVRKISSSKLTTDMLFDITKMLKQNKPVFLSAIAGAFSGHSWVIDGARYLYNNNVFLLHFNFGWGGKSNGYFSPSCLNPTKGIEYDDPSLDNTDQQHNNLYSWHFRMLTYDIP